MVWSTRKQDAKLIDVCSANSVGFHEVKKCINTYKTNPAVSCLEGLWIRFISQAWECYTEHASEDEPLGLSADHEKR